MLANDAKANITLLLKATGTARLTFGGTSISTTGALANACSADCCGEHSYTMSVQCNAVRPLPSEQQPRWGHVLWHADMRPSLPTHAHPAGAATVQPKTLSVRLTAGGHLVKLEWMQASGSSQVRSLCCWQPPVAAPCCNSNRSAGCWPALQWACCLPGLC